MFKIYYQLTKPGIIYGNAITTVAGFLLASNGEIDWRLFSATLVGISLVIASACVFNNLIDRDIDERMERTKNRALVTGSVSATSAILYATVLGIVGFVVLWLYANLLAMLIAFAGWFVYVCLYSPLKRRSIYATLAGSIAGAVPPAVGYTAVTNKFDLGAILLFFILVSWQMPHFYAIAIRRLDEYKAAAIPILALKKGVYFTKINILVYILGFIISASLLTVFGYTGYVYLAVALILGLTWLWMGVEGFKASNDQVWARKMFLFSLVVILALSLTISIDAIIFK